MLLYFYLFIINSICYLSLLTIITIINLINEHYILVIVAINYLFLLQEHKVIRFRKCDPGNHSSDDGLLRVNRERDFIKVVLSPYLQPYLNVPEILRFDRVKLDEFSKMIYSQRPGKN